MRPFLVRMLKKVPGLTLEDAIRQPLKGRSLESFEYAVGKGEAIEETFDIGEFPELIRHHWHRVFREYFGEYTAVAYDTRQLRTIRNLFAHGKIKALRSVATTEYLLLMAKVLNSVNEQSLAGEIQHEIDTLLNDGNATNSSEPESSVSEESEEISSAENTLETAVEPPDPEEAASSQESEDTDLDSDGFLVNGTYEFIVTLIRHNISSNGNPQFVIDFAHKDTGLIVPDWYPIGFSPALSKLALLMTEFDIDKAGLTEAVGNEQAMNEILDRLNSRLDSKDVLCDVVRDTWPDGRPRNKIERIINPNPTPPSRLAITEVSPPKYRPTADEDDLPF